MKPVILIHTTPAEAEINTAIRRTWVDSWGHLIPHFFMYDETLHGIVLEDEWRFPVPPGYWVMMNKTKAACAYALTQGYTHVFVICSDTYVVVPRLLSSGFSSHKYTGHKADEGHAGGGCGYWLNTDAMHAVCKAKSFNDYEDRWVGTVLRDHGILCHHDPRYWGDVHQRVEGIITVHMHQGAGKMPPEALYAQHEKFLKMGDV